MTAHEIHALTGAYAVDALDDHERALFEEHLAECPECQAEVAGLLDTSTMLSAATEAAPPAELRAKVLADIKNVRPLPPVVSRLEARRPRRWATMLAAAVLLGAVGGGATVWQQTRDDAGQVQASAVDQVLKAADVQHFTVALEGGASATVSRSLSEGRSVLVTRNMPAAPKDHAYELWLLDDSGTMHRSGLMTQGGDQTVLFDRGSNGMVGAGITIEPEGGSEVPTSAPIAQFDFEQQS